MLLMPAEAAKELRTSQSTLAKWRSAGKGPPWFKMMGSIRYDSQMLQQWIESQITESVHALTGTMRDVELSRINQRNSIQRSNRFTGHQTKRERSPENGIRAPQ